MNDPRVAPDPILASALRILAELAASENPAASAVWSAKLAAQISSLLPSPADRSAELVGPNRSGPGLRWHAEQLAELCARPSSALSSAELARRRYHARMLGHGLAPQRSDFRPLVTILLPVYNRAGLLVEAVQSCLAQTWRPIEILVIDDGSTDDVPSALERFGGEVRLVRKPNGGDASARNLGLRAATGDFVHFLDSDDLLTPNAVQDAVAAFEAVADADLSYGQAQWIDMRTDPPQLKPLRFRAHADPVRAMIVAFAFAVPTVMMSRWRMLAMPPFEEDLTRSSDWRYWQALGFARAKVVGMRAQSAFLRRLHGSLQGAPHLHDDSHALAVLRGLRDLARHPHAWHYAAEYLNVVAGARLQPWFSGVPSRRLEGALSELALVLGQGCVAAEEGSLSLLPMLAAMRGRIARLARDGAWAGRDPRCVYRGLAQAVARAIETALPISDRDIAFWTRLPQAASDYRGLQKFFASVARCCPPAAGPALADALLRGATRIPAARVVRAAARLRPAVGSRLAAAISTLPLRWRAATGAPR